MTTPMPLAGEQPAVPADHATPIQPPAVDYPSPVQIAAKLATLRIKAVDPRSPATWARPETKSRAYTREFLRDQQITYRAQVSPVPVKIEAQAKLKKQRAKLPSVTDMWLVASGYASAGDRLRVARGMLGWNQVVAALEAGQSNPSQLNQFELGKIPNLASLELVCRAIHIDIDWVRHGHDDRMPAWLEPWRRASIEAFALCDQMVKRLPDAFNDLVLNQRGAHVFLSWFNNPETTTPQRQPWWDDLGSLLPWFAEASSHYNLTNAAIDTVQLTERAHRDLEAIVVDWCVLRAKIEQVPGLTERIRSPGRQLSLADGKRLEAEFRRVQRWTRKQTVLALPTNDAALDAVTQGMIPHRHHLRTVQPIADGKHRSMPVVVARRDPPHKPKSKRGRKKAVLTRA